MARFKVSYMMSVTLSGEQVINARTESDALDELQRRANSDPQSLTNNPCLRSLVGGGRAGVEVEWDYVEEV